MVIPLMVCFPFILSMLASLQQLGLRNRNTSSLFGDLFLCYGFWHPYYYMNIAIGNEFRVPFLGPLFFKLFPDEKKLMRRGQLQHNVTLFSWMRLAYPNIASTLQERLVHFRKLMISHDLKVIEEILSKKRASWVENPYRARSCSLITFHF